MCVLLKMFSAYGATLIEHSFIEAGLPGSIKVDSQENAAEGETLHHFSPFI